MYSPVSTRKHVVVDPNDAVSLSVTSLTQQTKDEVSAIVESAPKLPFGDETAFEELDAIEKQYFNHNPMAMCNVEAVSKTVIGHEDLAKEVLVPLRCLNRVRRTLGYRSFEEMLGEGYLRYIRVINKHGRFPQIRYVSFLFPRALEDKYGEYEEEANVVHEEKPNVVYEEEGYVGYGYQ
jgi:hypothetical protein